MKRKQNARGRKPRKPEEAGLPWGRPPSRQEAIQNADKKIRFRHALFIPDDLKTFQAIADFLTRRSGARVTPGTLYRYVIDGKEPKKNLIRKAMGLPTTRLVRANPPTRWRDLPLAELRRAIEGRKEYKLNG